MCFLLVNVFVCFVFRDKSSSGKRQQSYKRHFFGALRFMTDPYTRNSCVCSVFFVFFVVFLFYLVVAGYCCCWINWKLVLHFMLSDALEYICLQLKRSSFVVVIYLASCFVARFFFLFFIFVKFQLNKIYGSMSIVVNERAHAHTPNAPLHAHIYSHFIHIDISKWNSWYLLLVIDRPNQSCKNPFNLLLIAVDWVKCLRFEAVSCVSQLLHTWVSASAHTAEANASRHAHSACCCHITCCLIFTVVVISARILWEHDFCDAISTGNCQCANLLHNEQIDGSRGFDNNKKQNR